MRFSQNIHFAKILVPPRKNVRWQQGAEAVSAERQQLRNSHGNRAQYFSCPIRARQCLASASGCIMHRSECNYERAACKTSLNISLYLSACVGSVPRCAVLHWQTLRRLSVKFIPPRCMSAHTERETHIADRRWR